MSKKYLDKNVYDAANERIEFVFNNFERIYLSFSGGKDSGVMLNLVIDYMRRNNIEKKIGVMVMDNEANYEHSLNFMHDILNKNRDLLDVYWCCLPITLPCTISSYTTDWKCWCVEEEYKWIRPLPDKDYVVSYKNNPIEGFKKDMSYDHFWDCFGEWYSQGKRTACLIGIRADESLNRFRAIANEKKETLYGEPWTKRNSKNVYNCYPIYDWTTEDIWTANAKFGWSYNKLYDIFYMAGLTIAQMRVASPFMSEAKSSLNMYRVIEPQVWNRLVSRVFGVNFIATYGKQLDYKKVKLPEGHTWKSFTKFLLSTLPDEIAENYRNRFIQSLKYWGRTGRGVPDEIIKELGGKGYKFELNGKTAYGNKNLDRVIFRKIPDHVDDLSCHNSKVASWKRLAITILRNDHTCKYLGLMPTQELQRRQKEIMEKYKCL